MDAKIRLEGTSKFATIVLKYVKERKRNLSMPKGCSGGHVPN